MKRYIFTILSLFLSTLLVDCFAQVTVGSGQKPGKAALLDLRTLDHITQDNESADKGLLLPRVNLTNINSLSPLVPTATSDDNKQHIGLMVYNMSTASPLSLGVYIWNGNNWELYSQNNEPIAEFGGTNGITKSSSEIRLGGALTESTAINQAGHDLNFNATTGTFSVNSGNALTVSKGNTGIGTQADANSRLTVGGNSIITGDLNVNSSTSLLGKTTITNELKFKDPNVADPTGYILKSLDASGNASWVPTTEIPGYNIEHKEATITGSGRVLSISQWNTATDYHVEGIELKLTPGHWLVFVSIVVEPLPAAATNTQDPIWSRFYLSRYNNGQYSEPSTTQTAAVARISALNVSDRAYANVSKNVIKGYLILRVNGAAGTEETLRLTINNRSSRDGYAAWSTSNDLTSVRIGDSADAQNYIVAFPM